MVYGINSRNPHQYQNGFCNQLCTITYRRFLQESLFTGVNVYVQDTTHLYDEMVLSLFKQLMAFGITYTVRMYYLRNISATQEGLNYM
jgi:hypothetical protein